MRYYTKLRFGFKSKNQLALFMIWREYWEDNEVVFAETVFVVKGRKYKKLTRNLLH